MVFISLNETQPSCK